MSSDPDPLSLWQRLKEFIPFVRSKSLEKNLRHSIATLIQEADHNSSSETGDILPELDRQERALLANVLRLRDTTADDVMIPRADIIALSLDTSFDDALAFIRQENHSRLPVYKDELDSIVGMLHVKDLIAYIGSKENFQLKKILRQPLMTVPQIPVLDLLLQMRQRRIHLALVIDEYGGVDGLVTIEDLVETIVGDIADEHDEPEAPMIVERPDGSYDIAARMPLPQFEEKMGAILTDEERNSEMDTVGGLVFRLAGYVPARGEVISHGSGMVFRVLDADARHIYRLRVKKLPTPSSSTDTSTSPSTSSP